MTMQAFSQRHLTSLICLCVSGCAMVPATLPAIGTFDATNETMTGTITIRSTALAGTPVSGSKISIANETVHCEGESKATDITAVAFIYPTCAGQSSDVRLGCSDGRTITGTSKAMSCMSGAGFLHDNLGNPFSFSFGRASTYIGTKPEPPAASTSAPH